MDKMIYRKEKICYKKWMKYVLATCIFLCYIVLFKSVTVQAAMADEAEDYELQETYSGNIKGTSSWNSTHRYFKFAIDGKSHVTLFATISNSTCGMNIYDSSGAVVLKNEDLSYTENVTTGKYSTQLSRTLKRGTYYLDVSEINYNLTEFSFKIQAEEQIVLSKGAINSLKSSKKGQLTVKCEVTQNAIGYRILYSTDYKFKKNVKTVYSSEISSTIKGLKKGVRYYVKVCPYTVYDDGTEVYGQNSYVKSVMVKK